MVTINTKRLPASNADTASWLAYFKQRPGIGTLEMAMIERATEFVIAQGPVLTTFYGQSCLTHGFEIADILIDMHLDAHSLAAAIIVSTTRKLQLAPEIITAALGEPVTQLVKNVLQMDTLDRLEARGQLQLDRLRKTFLAMASDVRAILIRLAERTCLMRAIKHLPPVERQYFAKQTMDIYAPLANRLGIGQIKWELEDCAFHFLEPVIYKKIADFLAEKRIDREKRIADIVSFLTEKLSQAGIQATLYGRAKHIHSIHLKALRKQVHYDQIYDYSALRILVNTIPDCYAALSLIHSLFHPIAEEFDDYISHPKPNGYRSIHTAVTDAEQKLFEIQIRTFAIHEEAEHGVAAHWLYKEARTIEAEQEAKIRLVRQLLDWQRDLTQEIPSSEKKNLLDDTVYVFTPMGDIIDLPQGATALDFAYRIHTSLGHRCRGAKIRGQITPLTRPLQTGDVVEIMTVAQGEPSRDWLNVHAGYLKTSHAKSKVAHWFRQKTGLPTLTTEQTKSPPSQKKISKQRAPTPSLEKTTPLKTTPPMIEGVGNLLTRIAGCCKPVPDQEIIGYITLGRGVSIHRKDCGNIRHTATSRHQRMIPVTWAGKRR